MHPNHHNDNAHPIVQWLPFLRKIACQMEPRVQDREDLVQETVETALRRWDSYNPAESLPGWLVFNMRESFRRLRTMRSVRTASADDAISQPSVPARQFYATALSQVTSRLETRNGRILMRFAAGEDGPSIGADVGLSRQRVNQIVQKERAKLEAA